MIVREERTSIPVYVRAPFSDYFRPQSTGVLDLETTGLSPSGSHLILGGLLIPAGDCYTARQYFAEQPEEEGEVIDALMGDLARMQSIVTYNGKRFDLPFLRRRMEAVHQRTDAALPFNLDLLRIVRRYSQISRFLPNLKQKTLEDFLGLWTDRTDRIDGGESVRLYAQYVHTRQQDVLEQILLHNRDDICQLARLLQVIRKTDFHRAMSETGFPINGGRISSVALRRDGMYIEAVQETAPVEYAAVDEHGVHCRFSKADGRCRIRGTLVETAGMRFFDTAPFGSLAETFDGEPDFHDGFVLVAAGEKVNYRALNRLARALTERIKNDGL